MTLSNSEGGTFLLATAALPVYWFESCWKSCSKWEPNLGGVQETFCCDTLGWALSSSMVAFDPCCHNDLECWLAYGCFAVLFWLQTLRILRPREDSRCDRSQ